MTVEEAARERVLAAHRDTVATVLRCADVAAAGIAEPADRKTVVAAMEAALRNAGTLEALVALLRDAVDATDREFQAEPVAASPYLVVTARGPLMRATLADARLVVLVRAFGLDRAAGGYVRTDAAPGEAVEVRFRRRP